MRKALWYMTENSLTIGLLLLAACIAAIFGHAVAAGLSHTVAKLGGLR